MKNDKPRSRPKEIRRDGVIYTPSGSRTGSSPGSKPSGRPADSGHKERLIGPQRSRKKQKSGSMMGLFLAGTVLVGIVVLLVAFAIGFSAVTGNLNNSPKPGVSPTGATPIVSLTPNPSKSPQVSKDEAIGVVLGVDAGKKEITILNVSDDKKYTLTASGSSELKDKYGKNIVISEFGPGDLVESVFSKDDKTIQSLKISAQGLSLKSITNLKINSEAKTLAVGNDNFTLSDHLICLYNGQTYDIADIDPVDVASIKGYKTTIYYIELQQSHGYLSIKDFKDIINPSLELDTYLSLPIENSENIKVAEGPHVALIKGKNIQPYTALLDIKPGETFDLSLKEVEITSGYLNLTVTPDAVVTINGTEYSYNAPILLNFGEYNIKAVKEGYNMVEKKIVMDSAKMDVGITLEKVVSIATLNITCIPEGANIYIDNVYQGMAPVKVMVEYGNRTISAKLAGYYDVDFEVNISTPLYEPKIEMYKIPTTE